MSWHRQLHHVPESSPESQIIYPPTYPWLYGGSPPEPLPEPQTAPPTEPPTEPPMAPLTTVRSYPWQYGESPPEPLAKLLTPTPTEPPADTPSLEPPADTTPPDPPADSPPPEPPADTTPPDPPADSPPPEPPADSPPPDPPADSPPSEPPADTPPPDPPADSPPPDPPADTPPLAPLSLADTPPPAPTGLLADTPTPTPTDTSPYGNPPSVVLIVGTVIGGLILLVAVGIFFIWCRRRNQKRPEEGLAKDDERQHICQSAISNDSNPQMLQSSVASGPFSSSGAVHRSLYLFSYEDLAKATDNFSKTNFRGEGGYGTVHEGVLPDGKRVAIKQLRLYSNQGEKEFKAEVEIISRVHHKNLVSLVGYCISEEHKILVYEFVPNGTLHFNLHEKEEPTIDWPTRMKIALGSANGLAYLHEECHPQIIHRDIKAANILLDDKFVVKVADFGLAKFSSDTKSYVSTGVKGTWGYLDPAYLRSEKLTDEADIFSFGVVLLELITGRVPKRETELLYQWAKPLVKQALENGNFHALIDPRLQNEYNPNEMHRMVACAAACVRNSASNRPKMSQIVRALEGNLSLEDLNGGIKPGDSGEFGSYGSKSYDTNQRKEDLKKYNKLLQEDHKEDTNEQSEPSTNYVSTLQTAR